MSSRWDKNMVVMIKLAAINIFDKLAVNNLLWQLDRHLHPHDIRPNVCASTWLLRDVCHLAFSRGFENCLVERIW